MKKSIPTAELREQITGDIDFWLKQAAEEESKKNACEIGSFKWENASNERFRLHSMAHALYLLGTNLGVVSENDYPQFKRSEEENENV